MKEIRGNAKSLRKLLANTKFAIDYYQREYRWQTKQVAELIEDLAGIFLDHFTTGDAQKDVKFYGHYFLGSVIVSKKAGRRFIIDGQQRLTTLTLLLVHLYRNLPSSPQKEQLGSLIYSYDAGEVSFNLDVEERNRCMDALYNGKQIDESDEPQSVVNIVRRYRDIEELFPSDIAEQALPHFADWLIDNVHLVEIRAYTDADAYLIFETMNDRGLSVTPTEMLKGYLLANITEPKQRDRANSRWLELVSDLRALDKHGDADAIRAWTRAQYARTIRQRKKGAAPGDFDRLGTEFHRWVRDHAKDLNLLASSDFLSFIEENFRFYARWYGVIRGAADRYTSEKKAIYFCAQNGFTLQYPVLLAPLCKDDSDVTVHRKLSITSSFLDILIARRIWNFRAIHYSTMHYAMFQVMRDIRGKNVEELIALLSARLSAQEETFAKDTLHLHGRNGPQVHRILARMTDYIETRSERVSRYGEYSSRRYQIEHIWAVPHYAEHTDEFEHEWEFGRYRNRIGGLVLLKRPVNPSLGALPYEKKLDHYVKENLLTASLHKLAYDRDPGFRRFRTDSNLPFRQHSEFRKSDFDQRQELYRRLAEQIWSPGRLATGTT